MNKNIIRCVSLSLYTRLGLYSMGYGQMDKGKVKFIICTDADWKKDGWIAVYWTSSRAISVLGTPWGYASLALMRAGILSQRHTGNPIDFKIYCYHKNDAVLLNLRSEGIEYES